MSSRLFLSLQRAEDRLLGLGTIETLLARMEAGSATGEERECAARAIEEQQRPDGSWQGSLLRTAESLLLLRELREGQRTNDIDCGLDWIHDRSNRPGRFGDSCETDLHALRLCNHFVAGFFAPAPRSVPLAGLRLIDGSSLGGDRDARIATSALACAALLRFGEDGAHLRLQVDGLSRIVEVVSARRFELSPAALICVARCLCAAPDATTARDAALVHIAQLQRADGSWPGLDMFVVLDLFSSVAAEGRAPAAVQRALGHAARLLFLMQQPDGSWGRETGPWQLLAGWRALRLLAGDTRLRSAAAPAHGQ